MLFLYDVVLFELKKSFILSYFGFMIIHKHSATNARYNKDHYNINSLVDMFLNDYCV